MYTHQEITVGRHVIDAFVIPLSRKNFILLKGAQGYCMCGYLNLAAARRFGDVAVRITGVSTIEEALQAPVAALSPAARARGIRKGQIVRDILPYFV